jgi:hypothetical protein
LICFPFSARSNWLLNIPSELRCVPDSFFSPGIFFFLFLLVRRQIGKKEEGAGKIVWFSKNCFWRDSFDPPRKKQRSFSPSLWSCYRNIIVSFKNFAQI